MTLILQNIGKLFEPKFKNLDAKLWVQKVILKKYYSDKFHIEEKITKKKYENTHQQVLNHFGIYSGYSQQFLFKMERDLNEKKWL